MRKVQTWISLFLKEILLIDALSRVCTKTQKALSTFEYNQCVMCNSIYYVFSEITLHVERLKNNERVVGLTMMYIRFYIH